MAIWGSLIGGMIGLSLGGPFGMLLGSLIGGKISRARSSSGFKSFAQPQQIFALSLIVLSAKLSKADGQISKEELIAVKDKLKIPGLVKMLVNKSGVRAEVLNSGSLSVGDAIKILK